MRLVRLHPLCWGWAAGPGSRARTPAPATSPSARPSCLDTGFAAKLLA